MIEFYVHDEEVIAKLNAMPSKLRLALTRKVTKLRLLLEARVKQKVSGQVLNVRTGRLRRSIFSETITEENSVRGRVASSGDVKYAAIHEYGGMTKAHDILPVKAKVLAFTSNGKTVFARRVHHPGSKMPERSFMRSSLREMQPTIISELRQIVEEADHA